MVTTTTTYSFKKPTVGQDEDLWGGYLNDSMDLIDDVLDGTTPVTGIDINSGTIDNTVIGGTTPAAGTFTTVTATSYSGDGSGLSGINTDLVGDTTPQLGGNLDTNGYLIAGRNIATDGTKLDGIESGATADQTKSDIDALGINAATLDSLDSTQFLRSDAADVVSGALDFQAQPKITIAGYAGFEYYNNSSTWEAYVGTENNSGNLRYNSRQGTHTWYSNSTSRMALTSAGSLSTTVQGTLWGSGNDGSGSGLDADTVDGLQASSFLRSDAADTASGLLSLTGGAKIHASSGTTSNYLLLSSTNELELFNSSGSVIDLYLNYSGGANSLKGPSGGTIWHSGNDGSGSGLDADTVDGIQASSFLRSDADDSASGDITFTQSIQIQSGGGSGNPIRIGNGFGTGGSATIHRLNGDLYLQYANGQSSTNLFLGGGGTSVTLNINDSNTKILEGSGNSVRVQTNNGYVDIGPTNSSYCHIQTDRSQFYFNTQTVHNGNIIPYTDSTRTLGSSSNRWSALYADTLYGDGSNLTNLPSGTSSSKYVVDGYALTGGTGGASSGWDTDGDNNTTPSDYLNYVKYADSIPLDSSLSTAKGVFCDLSGTTIGGLQWAQNSILHAVVNYKGWSSRWITRNPTTTTNYGALTIDSVGGLSFHAVDPSSTIVGYSFDLVFNVSGDGAFCSAFNAMSDIRIKENIELIDDPVTKLQGINGYSYNLKTTGKKSYGVIAQEVEEVLPHAVTESKDVKAVDYNAIVALLVETVKKQEQRIAELEKKVGI